MTLAFPGPGHSSCFKRIGFLRSPSAQWISESSSGELLGWGWTGQVTDWGREQDTRPLILTRAIMVGVCLRTIGRVEVWYWGGGGEKLNCYWLTNSRIPVKGQRQKSLPPEHTFLGVSDHKGPLWLSQKELWGRDGERSEWIWNLWE